MGYFWFIMATLEEVVTQVRLLTEAQRQLENQLLQESSLRQSAESQLQAVVGTLMGSRSATMQQLVDTRMLGKPGTWDGSESGWKDWKFVTASYLLAAMPTLEPLLARAEQDASQSVLLTDLGSEEERAASTQLYFTLAMLTKGRSLDKIQGAGQGEGLQAWRLLHEQWEPRARPRFVGMLIQLLTFKFDGDILAGIEQWERLIRDFEQQSSFVLPDFVRSGILISGMQDHSLRDHLGMHSSRLDDYTKLRREIVDILRTRQAMGPTPMQVDALKGKGKGKSKGKSEKGKAKSEPAKGKGKEQKPRDDKDLECYYCGRKGHRKADCRKLKKDKEDGQVAGKPPTRMSALGDKEADTLDSLRAAPREADYIFVVSDAADAEHLDLCGMLMVDSGAAVNACPLAHAPTVDTTRSRRDVELQNASGDEVRHHGSKTVSYSLAEGQSALVEYEVADVHAPLLSVSRMVDMGATVVFSPCGAHIQRPGKAPVPLVRRNNVFWLPAEVQEISGKGHGGVQALCPLPEISLEEPVEAQLVAGELGERARPVRAKRLPGEPDLETRLQHELTHLPPRDWCEFCVAGRGKDDSHTRRKAEPGRIPEVQIDYMFVGRRGEPKTVSIAHGVDSELGYHVAVRCDKGPVDYVVKAFCEFLKEIGRARVVLRTDGEPAVKALAEAVAAERAELETLLETTSVKSSQSIGVVEAGNYQLAAQIRVLKADAEAALGITLDVDHPMVAWLIRHSAWLLNRFAIGKDGYTAFERSRGRSFKGEMAKLFEMVLYRPHDVGLHKFEDRVEVGMWLGKTTKSDDHLIFLKQGQAVVRARTLKRRTPGRRWDKEYALAMRCVPWQMKMPEPKLPAGPAGPREIPKRYITWKYVQKYGGTPGCRACSVDSTNHSKECRARFEAIFEKETQEADAARIQAERKKQEEQLAVQAEEREAQSPPVAGPDVEMSAFPAASSSAATVPALEGQGSTASSFGRDVRMKATTRSAAEAALEDAVMDTSEDHIPDSKKARMLAGLSVCVLYTVEGGDSAEISAVVSKQILVDQSIIDEYMSRPVQIVEPTCEVYGIKSGTKLDPKLVRLGRQKEMNSMFKHHVIELVRNRDAIDGKHIKGDWVEDMKGDNVRSRFVAKEVAYERRFDVTQSTPPVKFFRVLLSLAATRIPGARARLVGIWDISVAFFHAPMEGRIYVHPQDRSLVPEGCCWLLRRALYGTRMASQLWGKLVTQVLLAAKFEEVMVMPMVFVKADQDILVGIHGDDFGAVSDWEGLSFLNTVLKDNFEAKWESVIGPGHQQSGKLLRRTLAWSDRGFEWHSDPRHARNIVEALGLEKAVPSLTPGSKDTGKNQRNAEDLLEPARASTYASCVGSALYLAADRPDLQYAVGRLMSKISSSREMDWTSLKHLGRYLVGRPECVWLFEYQEVGDLKLDSVVDANWADGVTDSRKSVDSVHEFLGKHLTEASNCTQQVIAISSGESELYGMVRGAASLMQMGELLKACGHDLVKTVYSDSSAARGMVRRTGTGRVRHIEAKYLWIQTKVRDGSLSVGIVDTEHNSADMGTKHLAEKTLTGLMRLLPIVCGKELEPGTVRRAVLLNSLTLAAAAGDIVATRSAVSPAGSTHQYGHVLLVIIFIVLLTAAFAFGWLAGTFMCTTGEAKKLQAELALKGKEAALQRLTVAELKVLVLAAGITPGAPTKALMVDYLLMHEMRQVARRAAAKPGGQ